MRSPGAALISKTIWRPSQGSLVFVARTLCDRARSLASQHVQGHVRRDAGPILHIRALVRDIVWCLCLCRKRRSSSSPACSRWSASRRAQRTSQPPSPTLLLPLFLCAIVLDRQELPNSDDLLSVVQDASAAPAAAVPSSPAAQAAKPQTIALQVDGDKAGWVSSLFADDLS